MLTVLAVGGSAASVQDRVFAERLSIDDLHGRMISATHVKEFSCIQIRTIYKSGQSGQYMLTQESQLTIQITSQTLGMSGT